MDGNSNYRGANFATNFRRELMGEHLGINPNDPILDDPVSKEFFSLVVSRAESNTQIYHDIFGCYPDDAYTNFNLLKQAKLNQKQEKPVCRPGSFLYRHLTHPPFYGKINKILGFRAGEGRERR